MAPFLDFGLVVHQSPSRPATKFDHHPDLAKSSVGDVLHIIPKPFVHFPVGIGASPLLSFSSSLPTFSHGSQLAPHTGEHCQNHHRSVASDHHEEEQEGPKVSSIISLTATVRLSIHHRRQHEEHGNYQTTTTTVGRHAFYRCYSYLVPSASGRI